MERYVYAWVTHDEAERATLPARVGPDALHPDIAAAQAARNCAPADAFYLVRVQPAERLIAGYA